MRKLTYLRLLVFFFLISAACVESKTGNPSDEWGKVYSEATKGGYQLISTEELREEYLKDPNSLSFVDVRQEWSYQMQHIKGALHIDFAPTWWNQYSPMMRSDMKNLLGPHTDRRFVFY
jgi:hypothetical protein